MWVATDTSRSSRNGVCCNCDPTSVVLPASGCYAQQVCRHVEDQRSAALVCNVPSAQAGADETMIVIVALYDGTQPSFVMPRGGYMDCRCAD
jgi:hypothetical protein